MPVKNWNTCNLSSFLFQEQVQTTIPFTDLVIISIKNHWSSSQILMTVHIMHVGSAKSWMDDIFYRYTTSPELFLHNIPIFPEEILYKVENSYLLL